MGIYHLEKIFNPKSIAVIGASDKQGTIGNALMTNIIQGQFPGSLVPVNPKYGHIHGLKASASVAKIKEPIDLAVIATPMATVPSIIDECVDKHVGGVIIISAGGKEIGEKGREIEARIREKAYNGGVRIIGPNCLGIMSPDTHLNASFASDMPKAGHLAFVSQSGAICTAILDLAFREKMGFSHFVSIGSMLDVDFGDMIDYLGNDPKTQSILLYIENLTNFRKFMSAARSVSRIKPIVVLKSGRSAAGARAASSHTGAMAGEDVVYDTAFKRAGIVRVNTIEELFDCAELMAKQPRPRGKRLAIITNGGGPGVMATDALAGHGVDPVALSPELMDKLDAILPPFWSHNNPIDILGDASADRYIQTIETCIHSKNFDAVMVIFAPQALTDPFPVANALAQQLKDSRHPVFACWMGGKRIRKAVETMNQAGIPTYETPERAIRAFMYMYHYARNLEMLQEIPPRLTKEIEWDTNKAETIIRSALKTSTGFLNETDSKQILDAYGIPVNITRTATTPDQAVDVAREVGFPVALKLLSPDITHKTDANGVHLDIHTPDAVVTAFQTIMDSARAYDPDARILGVSIQKYIAKPDYELLVGAKKDENFGPVILFGMGGIYTEVLKDRNLGLPPLNRLLARRLMEETRAFKLLKGYRNKPPADMEKLEEMLIRLSQLIMDFPEIVELDMNPVIVKDGAPFAVDARILVRESAVKSPMHLVISPYPGHMESMHTTDEGMELLIRPVKPEDAPMFLDFFDILSPRTIYYRFFTMVKSLSHAMLVRFTQIDYDREIALLAVKKKSSGDAEELVGVARIVGDPDGKQGEFSVIVGDPWQGKGIGSRLLSGVLQIAQNRGMETVFGLVLKENREMLNLGKKLGFEARYTAESDAYELTIHLKGIDLSGL